VERNPQGGKPDRPIRCRLAVIQTGILLALASAVLFGASTPFAKLLLGGVDPWLMAGLLYCGAGIGLAAVHLSRLALRMPPTEAPLRPSDVPWLALVILAGGVLGPLLLMLGLAQTEAAAASLLLNLEGVATMGITSASRTRTGIAMRAWCTGIRTTPTCTTGTAIAPRIEAGAYATSAASFAR
jgi:drug/metabolite transporter (DMT)-like permease